MGKDNLFHKRKARKKEQLARRGKQRDPYAKVLIACEGKKTEPLYFEDIKDYFALNSVNVKVSGECGSDPVSVFKHGKQLYREEREKGDSFDKVYCVFDQDAHASYIQAIKDINNAWPNNTFIAINSVPCFEYWLLLHFQYTTKPFKALPNNSACNQVLTQLKSHIPDYTKGKCGIFAATCEQLNSAKERATKALRTAQESDTDNPTTHVHELVSYLQDIKKPL